MPQILRERRLALGLSQADVGKAVGVSVTAVTHWEKGTHRPRRKHMGPLARALAMPEKQLTGEESFTVDTLAPMSFDLPGFLTKLDDLIASANEVRSDLRELQAARPEDAPKKGAKRKKTKKSKPKRSP